MTGITLTPTLNEIGPALTELRRRTGDISKALEYIGTRVLLPHIDLNFKEQHDPWGKPWKPLSKVTLARRRKEGKGAKILEDVGTLRNSFSYRVLKNSLEIGTADVRAGTHIFGAKQGQYGRTKRNGPIPWGDIPARPMLPLREPLPEDLVEEMSDAMQYHLDLANGPQP